jgi:hypothetical protein
MGVRIAGMVLPELPAKILKQGSAEGSEFVVGRGKTALER